jgi:hypothetical protein
MRWPIGAWREYGIDARAGRILGKFLDRRSQQFVLMLVELSGGGQHDTFPATPQRISRVSRVL